MAADLFLVFGVLLLFVLIFGVRIVLNQRRAKKALHYVQTGEHAKAFQLFVKSLTFHVATKKGDHLLKNIIDLYKAANLGEDEIQKIRSGYDVIKQNFDQRVAELDKQKLSSNKKMDKLAEFSKEAGNKINTLFAQFPPLLDRTAATSINK